MRSRDLILAPLLSCLLVLPGSVLAAPADEGEAEQDPEAEQAPEEEVDEAKLEEAKKLYKKAERLAKKNKWKQAAALYEEAYYLVPGKHGFAHKVGMASHRARDCEKAVDYMVHFLTYAVDEKFDDRRASARRVLKKSLEKGCTTEEELNNIHLSREEIEEKARELYQQAEEFAAAEQWADAAMTYEQAYYLVPHKVGFSHKVGMAAYKLGDCDMAHQYLVHFVEYADPAKHNDRMSEATGIILELEKSGCVSSEEMEEHQFENPFEVDPDSKRDAGNKDKESGGNKGLLIGGSVLTVVGLGGIGAGIAGFVLAGSSQSKLDALASTDTPTGLPDAAYSCSDPSDTCPQTLETQINNRRVMGIVGVSVGIASLAGGVALIVLHARSKKQSGGTRARLDSLGPMPLPGGGGAAARLRF